MKFIAKGKVHISEMLRGHSFENILKEIEKCEILCANCHRIHHYDEKNKKAWMVELVDTTV